MLGAWAKAYLKHIANGIFVRFEPPITLRSEEVQMDIRKHTIARAKQTSRRAAVLPPQPIRGGSCMLQDAGVERIAWSTQVAGAAMRARSSSKFIVIGRFSTEHFFCTCRVCLDMPAEMRNVALICTFSFFHHNQSEAGAMQYNP